jgi:long-subunit fatty acid transport protein
MKLAPLLLFFSVVLHSLAWSSSVHAGGLYLTDRGTRQLGRGGAFAAGTDDGQSLWYNPAGLAFTGGRQLQLDATLSLFRGSFQRVSRDNLNDSSKVDADAGLLPIPTLAYTENFGLEDWSFGFAVMAPNAVMLSWPQTVKGMPGPTRHSLISMEGSVIAHVALGLSWQPIKGLSIGVGGHLIPSRFRVGVYLSACDYGTLCPQPENPDWEAPATIDLERALSATGVFGVIYRHKYVRIGGSFMLPYTIEGDAKLQVELPSAPLFGSDDCGSIEQRRGRADCAQVNGDTAHIALDMPMVARFGVEVVPFERLRVEVGIVYEGWSRQEKLPIDPNGITITDALGIDRYDVGPISLKRDMQDVYSLRMGGELQPIATLPLTVRAGILLENSAFATRTLTPTTLDSQKLLVGLGLSYELVTGLSVDVLYAHMFMKDQKVRDSEVYPQNPLRPPPPSAGPGEDPQLSQPEPVGNGNYEMEADLLGLGLRWNI